MTAFDPNGRRQVYYIDMDGTLTNGELHWKEEPTPNPDMVKYIRMLYTMGNTIIIWTARNGSMYNETEAWLLKNGIWFHALRMNKGGADYYVDDKCMSPAEFMEHVEAMNTERQHEHTKSV